LGASSRLGITTAARGELIVAENFDQRQRTLARRWFAGRAGVIATVLLVGGFLLTQASGVVHRLGVLAFGYGIGVAVMALLLALGFDPRRRK